MHMPALPVVPVTTAPVVVADTAPTTDSVKDFGTTLSTALGEGQTGAALGDPSTNGETTTAETAVVVEVLAGGGNSLPPVLPPEVPVTPEQILTVVLEALGAKVDVDVKAKPASNDGDAPSPAASPLTTLPRVSVQGDVAPTRALPSLPESVLASVSTAPVMNDPVTSPANFLPLQSGTDSKAMPGGESFKQAVMENISRLGSVIEVAGNQQVVNHNEAATPAPAMLTNAVANAPLAAPAPAGASLHVPVSFGQAAWGQAMGQQVVWAVSQQMTSADLHLSPPELGPVSVRIKLEADQASISFAAAHGTVREAIEAALPRLRDMLATQGIALTDANVTSQEQFQQAARERGTGSNSDRAGGEQGGDEAVAETRTVTRTLRLLDTYA
jgi:flagellar hook-length control protein FliK